MNSEKYASVQILNMVLAYAVSGGCDLNAITGRTGIDLIAVRDRGRIGIDQFHAVVSAVAGMSGGVFSGLRFAETVRGIYGRNHILMSIMLNCPSLENALEKLIRYHDISSNSYTLRLDRGNQYTALVWTSDIRLQSGLESVIVEAALASCAIMLRSLTTEKIGFAEIHFAHRATAGPGEYSRIFGCPVVFESDVNKIVFSSADLSLPIALSDPGLLEALEAYARKILCSDGGGGGWADRITECVGEMMIKGENCTVQDAAEKMSVSVRTLQKRLREENTSYRKLLGQVKKTMAVNSLTDSEVPLTDIAFLLGFSEQSAFNHAFKNWTGLSPGQYKKQCR